MKPVRATTTEGEETLEGGLGAGRDIKKRSLSAFHQFGIWNGPFLLEPGPSITHMAGHSIQLASIPSLAILMVFLLFSPEP
jgi:hypothetical protein